MILNMKKLQSGFIIPALLITIVLLAVGGGIYIYKLKNQNNDFSVFHTQPISQEDGTPGIGTYEQNMVQSAQNQVSSSNTASVQSQNSLLIQNTTYVNTCNNLTNYSPKEYHEGWKKIFQTENNISNAQFDAHITVQSVSLQSLGNTCELSVKYVIKKDWLIVNRTDSMTLGVPVSITPNNLPLESDTTKNGRIGVSRININNKILFSSQNQALIFYLNKYNLSNTNATIKNNGFQYFWDRENAIKSGNEFAGKGGEAYISISGIINQSQNKCFNGELSLSTQVTTYQDSPCAIN